MKTTGLTLQEALQALVDGKARAASHPNSDSYLIFNCEKNYFVWEGVHIGFTFASDQLTPEWSLIAAVQEYEDVEVVRWAVLTRDGYIIRYLKSQPESDTGIRIIKMTGIDRIPKKEKVTRRVEVKAMIDGAGYTETRYNNCEDFIEFPKTHGKTGKLIFEWEE